MKRFVPEDFTKMIDFFCINLSDDLDCESIKNFLKYSLDMEYRSMSLENLGLLNDVENIFHRNIEKFSSEAQENFFHEYGHLYEALLRKFSFNSIHIFDDSMEHIFYRRFYSKTKVGYKYRNKLKNRHQYNSFSLLSKKCATIDDLKMVAIGGFKQDFIRNSKSSESILKGFGIDKDNKIVSNSDASYIISPEQKTTTNFLFTNQ
ncbi:hypothetical protein [Enterococcus faecalis]|uniref:hypothetical protein n=1 Tax=Enterococcus faecalis TaxID=1351 RepID=UPI0034CDD516